MKKIEHTFHYFEYQSKDELEIQQQLLLDKALYFLNNAYAPYSGFKVGAAVELDNGKIVGGSNQENASYPLCICAEQTVLSHCGAIHPKIPIKRLAIRAVSANQTLSKPASPCGACRQIILEYENRQNKPIEIILQGETGPIIVFNTIKTLIPLSFDGSEI